MVRGFAVSSIDGVMLRFGDLSKVCVHTFLCTNASSIAHPFAASFSATLFHHIIVHEVLVYTAGLLFILRRFARVSGLSCK